MPSVVNAVPAPPTHVDLLAAGGVRNTPVPKEPRRTHTGTGPRHPPDYGGTGYRIRTRYSPLAPRTCTKRCIAPQTTIRPTSSRTAHRSPRPTRREHDQQHRRTNRHLASPGRNLQDSPREGQPGSAHYRLTRIGLIQNKLRHAQTEPDYRDEHRLSCTRRPRVNNATETGTLGNTPGRAELASRPTTASRSSPRRWDVSHQECCGLGPRGRPDGTRAVAEDRVRAGNARVMEDATAS